MPRGASITVENSFSKGLITESTAMNFPEQAVTETLNCVYSEFGEVSRRPGMEFEAGFVASLHGNSGACTEYEWFAVKNSGSTRMVVQQMGNMLRFYRVSTQGSLSSGIQPFSINLMSVASAGATPDDIFRNECQFTTGRGYLFVTHPFCTPFYVEYFPTSNQIVGRGITVQVRDITGVSDELPIDTNPTQLSEPHRYNLLNQGWYASFNGQAVLDLWRNNPDTRGSRGDWPSNADIWWLNKRTALRSDAKEEGNEIVDFQMADRVALGNTPSPKGHFVLDAFVLDRSATTGVAGIPVETAGPARPTTCVFYAGRVWYAGVKAPKFSSRVYFSQLIERDDQFGRCYQINDPTSETTFDIIDTDGGTLELPLIEDIVAFRVLKDSLLVFGTNGIYIIRGSDSGPFRATNYIVEYVSDIGLANPKSLVSVDNGLVWWGEDAIYMMSPDQTGLSFQVQNISKTTIQSFIDAIPSVNKKYIKGAYSRRERLVRWIYADDTQDVGHLYTKILEMNVAVPSFYPFRISSPSELNLAGIIVVSGQSLVEVDDLVRTRSNEPIESEPGVGVYIKDQRFVPQPEVFKFLTRVNELVLYSELSDPTHKDWTIHTNGGMNFESYGVSGFRVRGELLRKFNTTPIVFTMKPHQNGALQIKGIWDYGERESVPQEIYYKHVNPTKTNFSRRIKIRGKGRALQLRFDAVGIRPFTLLGWATFDTGGTIP